MWQILLYILPQCRLRIRLRIRLQIRLQIPLLLSRPGSLPWLTTLDLSRRHRLHVQDDAIDKPIRNAHRDARRCAKIDGIACDDQTLMGLRRGHDDAVR